MNNQPPDHLKGNVESWQENAADYVPLAEKAWASDQPYWGIWEIPDSETGFLPQDMTGLDCIELGCGTAYVSAWMHRRGARAVAIDPTPGQLDTARRLRAEHQLDFVIEQGFAESLSYPDQSFDFAISEYGAALWADPYQWIPEAARLLKPGGGLVFLSNSPLSVICMPDHDADGPMGTQLLRPYFGLYRTVWPDAPGATEFHLTHGDWIDLLRANHFSIERLVELKAPPGSTTEWPWADPEWAAKWPSEEVWVVRKQAAP